MIVSSDKLFSPTRTSHYLSRDLCFDAAAKCYSWNVCCCRRCPEGVVFHRSRFPETGHQSCRIPPGNESSLSSRSPRIQRELRRPVVVNGTRPTVVKKRAKRIVAAELSYLRWRRWRESKYSNCRSSALLGRYFGNRDTSMWTTYPTAHWSGILHYILHYI